MDFFNAANVLLGSVNLVSPVKAKLFVGWEDLGGIARVRFNDLTRNGAIVLVDNLIIEDKIEIEIDIKPGGSPNSINPKIGIIPVAILGSQDFDAPQVDSTTVGYGPNMARPIHYGHVENINQDGYPDLVLHFNLQDTGIACSDIEASLTGQTFSSVEITGTHSVKTSGCQ